MMIPYPYLFSRLYQVTWLFLAALMMNLLPLTNAQAQFQGKIVFESKTVEGGQAGDRQDDRFILYVTPDRILLQGDNSYKIGGSIQTEGVLIRQDYKDFVFLTGDEQALKISKKDIDTMLNFIGDGESGSFGENEPPVDLERKDEERMITGYRTQKFIFRDREDPQDYLVLWMTQDIRINWGMLAEPWGNSSKGLTVSDFPFYSIFNDGYFPLRIEAYESSTLVEVTEAVGVDESSIARAMVQLPQGTKVLSFQDYLFQKMSQQ